MNSSFSLGHGRVYEFHISIVVHVDYRAVVSIGVRENAVGKFSATSSTVNSTLQSGTLLKCRACILESNVSWQVEKGPISSSVAVLISI